MGRDMRLGRIRGHPAVGRIDDERGLAEGPAGEIEAERAGRRWSPTARRRVSIWLSRWANSWSVEIETIAELRRPRHRDVAHVVARPHALEVGIAPRRPRHLIRGPLATEGGDDERRRRRAAALAGCRNGQHHPDRRQRHEAADRTEHLHSHARAPCSRRLRFAQDTPFLAGGRGRDLRRTGRGLTPPQSWRRRSTVIEAGTCPAWGRL